VLEHFGPAQIVELTFKLMFWATNKFSTAVGMDAPIDADRITVFHYGEDGEFVVHPHDSSHGPALLS